MHIDFPILFAETFLWALLLGALGTKRWLAVALSVVVVSCLHLTPIGLDLYLRGSVEAYAMLGFLAFAVLLSTGFVAALAAAIGMLIGNWILVLFQPSEELVVDELVNENRQD